MSSAGCVVRCGWMHGLLDVSMPGLCNKQQIHHTGKIYSSPSHDWHRKECDSRHLRCSPLLHSRTSTAPLSNDLTSLLGTPHFICLVTLRLRPNISAGFHRLAHACSRALCLSTVRRPLCTQTSHTIGHRQRSLCTICFVRSSGKHFTPPLV